MVTKNKGHLTDLETFFSVAKNFVMDLQMLPQNLTEMDNAYDNVHKEVYKYAHKRCD